LLRSDPERRARVTPWRDKDLGVMELGVKGIHVGKALRISGQSVTRCIDRGRNLFDKGHDVYQYLQ